MTSGGVGGQKLSPPLNYIFGENGILEENFDFFLPKNDIFSENFWNLSEYLQICCKFFNTPLSLP
jgi:hypothetical protein